MKQMVRIAEVWYSSELKTYEFFVEISTDFSLYYIHVDSDEELEKFWIAHSNHDGEYLGFDASREQVHAAVLMYVKKQRLKVVTGEIYVYQFE